MHFGLVLSGEKLIDSLAYKKRLLALEPEAVGGEMEGAGLYAAANDAGVDWILVKAICDWADGTKNSAAQPQAARNAAELVLADGARPQGDSVGIAGDVRGVGGCSGAGRRPEWMIFKRTIDFRTRETL